MSDKKPTQVRTNTPGSRRKLLKSALLGGGALYMAPERWSKPLIQSVVLPAHAQTSPGVLGDGPWSSGSPDLFPDSGTGRGVGNIASRMVDFLVRPAAAGANNGGSDDCRYIICIERTGSDDKIKVRLWVDALLSTYKTKTVTLSDDLAFSNLKFSGLDGGWTLEGRYDTGADRWRGTIDGPCSLNHPASLGQDSSNLASTSAFTGERIQVASAGIIRLAGMPTAPLGNPNWTAKHGPCPPAPVIDD